MSSDKNIVEYKLASPTRKKVDSKEGQDIIQVDKTLVEAVNEMIGLGFQPYGDPFVTPLTQLPTQAMVRYGYDKPLQRPSRDVLTRKE